jgi:hypothetical protein
VVPRITSKGKSFKGAGAYFLHDLKAQTAERVAFTHTENMLTDDPELALKVMAWTAAHARELKELSGQKLSGRQAENSVYTYCLAWAPDQNPDRAHMIAFGQRSLDALGLADHEALFVAHNDTDHKHLHVIANRVHPVTGLMAKLSQDRLVLSRLAQRYEQETGQVYCHVRVANNAKRERGAWVKAEKEQRQAETPAYQEKRAARIEAQRAAGQLAKEKEGAEQERASSARDLHAAFDRASAQDDRRYRAREIDRPAADEQREAQAAWAAERVKEREEARFEGREAARRSFMAERRAREWADYEAARWQALYDKQTERRDGLEQIQLLARQRFEDRLSVKYAQSERALDHRLAALTAEQGARGLKGLVARVSGRQAKLAGQRETYLQAKVKLAEQKEAERRVYLERQVTQRTRQRERQAAEHQRFAVRLEAIKARRDEAFELRERDRQAQLRTPRTPDRVVADRSANPGSARLRMKPARRAPGDVDLVRENAKAREPDSLARSDRLRDLRALASNQANNPPPSRRPKSRGPGP